MCDGSCPPPPQTFFNNLNSSSISLLNALSGVDAPLASVASVVGDLQRPSTGLTAVTANLTAINTPANYPSSTLVNSTIVDPVNNSSLTNLLQGQMDGIQVRCDRARLTAPSLSRGVLISMSSSHLPYLDCCLAVPPWRRCVATSVAVPCVRMTLTAPR